MRTRILYINALILLCSSCMKPLDLKPKPAGVYIDFPEWTGYNDVRLTIYLHGINLPDVKEMGLCYDEVNRTPGIDGPHFALKVQARTDTTLLDFQQGEEIHIRAYAVLPDTVLYSEIWHTDFRMLRFVDQYAVDIGKVDITNIVAFEHLRDDLFFSLIETSDRNKNYGVSALHFGIDFTQWRRDYKELKNQRPQAYAKLNDGYVIATIPFPAATPETYLITKLGLDGSIHWQKTFPVKYGNQFIAMTASSEYTFALLTRGYDYDNATQQKTQSQIYHQVVHSNGIVQSSTQIPWPTPQPAYPQLDGGVFANPQAFLLVEPGTQAGTKRFHYYQQQQWQWSNDLAAPDHYRPLDFISNGHHDIGYLLRSTDSTSQPLWFGMLDATAGTLRWQYTFSPHLRLATLLDGAAYYSQTGDVYLTGYSGLTGYDRRYALYKLNANGQLQWTHVFPDQGPGYGTEEFQRVAIDHQNRIHVLSEWSLDGVAHLQLQMYTE